jgi:hypothetical protein
MSNHILRSALERLLSPLYPSDKNRAVEIIEKARRGGRLTVTETEINFRTPLPEHFLVRLGAELQCLNDGNDEDFFNRMMQFEVHFSPLYVDGVIQWKIKQPTRDILSQEETISKTETTTKD